MAAPSLLRLPDGRINVSGKVVAFDPPRKLSVTWHVEWPEAFSKLPECLVTYEIVQAGGSVRLTMTESHSWDVPEAILSGGRMGWPAILCSLKSLLETGKPLSIADGAAAGDDRGDQAALGREVMLSAGRR